MAFKDVLKALRKQKGMTQEQLASSMGLSKSTISMYENGRREPDFEVLEAFADIFNVDMNTLMSHVGSKSTQPALNCRDTLDIARDLERLRQDLENADTLMFDGDPMSDEARESILAAMKLGLEAAKLKNKEKYTPKKYKKEPSKRMDGLE